MKVRKATKDDWPEFSAMWVELLDETVGTGGEILPTEKSMRFFRSLFDAYDSGELPGIALIADDAGVLMWGVATSKPMLDNVNDPYAIGWGTYVRESHRGSGISSRMRAMARRSLLDKGFKRLVGAVSPANESGNGSVDSLGFERTQQQVVWTLTEDADRG